MKQLIPLFLIIFLWSACEKDVGAPVIENVDPVFGPSETLVTFEGMNLADITELSFSGQVINFNTAYNSDNALLLRIPTNVPLGEHEVAITTAGGTATTNFRVTLEPPEIFEVRPESASPGETVTILGKNFFDPVEVYFFDSVRAEIITQFPDSMEVIVPDGVQKGRIRLNANGGTTLSPVNFFSVNQIVVNDFDGNGVRSDNSKWLYLGFINETAATAIQENSPNAIDGNYMKVTGTAPESGNWIGGPQSYFGAMGDDFTDFGISTGPGDTLLKMDINNNGRDNTHIILILLENNGSPNDFAYNIHVDWEGWQEVSIPLSRFEDLNGFIVDPAKVRILKIHLNDEGESNSLLEINVDNIRFEEIL